jgi:hypothetical protein
VDRKARVNLLAKDIATSNSHDAISVKELVGLLLDEAKDNLVATSGDATLRTQGQATAYMRLKRLASELPTKIKGDNQ